MNGLFLFLFLVSIVCLIIGLIQPKVFTRFFKTKTNRKFVGTIFGISIILFFILFGVTSGTPTPKKSEDSSTKTETKTISPEEQAKADADAKAKAEATKELHADVKFSSTAFKITNKEAQNWTGCKFVLNGKVFGSDFTYKTTAGINANDSIIIPMNEFTKGDGTRFDPYSIKAKNLFISCDVEGNHRTGYYTISE